MIPGFGLNLKLRWKFFIILLVFSLTPLIVVTVVSQRGTLILGKTISEANQGRHGVLSAGPGR